LAPVEVKNLSIHGRTHPKDLHKKGQYWMKMHESIHERENMVSKASLVLKTIVKSKKSMKSALACEKHQQKQIITFY